MDGSAADGSPREAAPELEVITERLDALACWIHELETQVRAATTASDPSALKELGKALEAWSKHDPKLEERVTNRVDVLADRLRTLATTANTTAAALAGREGEVARLRCELEQSNERLDDLARDVRLAGSPAELADLKRAVAALSEGRRAGAEARGSEIMPAAAHVLAERIDTLAKTISTTAAGLAKREGELATLRRVFDEAAHASTIVGEVQQSVETLAARLDSVDGDRGADLVRALEARLEELAGGVEALSQRVDSLDLATVREDLRAESARIDSLAEDLRGAIAAVARAQTTDQPPEAQLASLGRQLELLTGRLAQLESSTSTMSGAWASEKEALASQLEALASVAPPPPAAASTRALEDLAARLEALEADAGARASESALAAASIAERLGSVESLLAELTVAAQSAAAGGLPDDDPEERVSRLEDEARAGREEVGELRALVDGLRMRLASSERELAAVAGSRDVLARLDELTRRVDSVEVGPSRSLPEPVGAPGEGRFRVELRSLELRMEHAEAAARENREAVLTQLERLASRIDWRLRQLESVSAATAAPLKPRLADRPLGQVVPIRGDA